MAKYLNCVQPPYVVVSKVKVPFAHYLIQGPKQPCIDIYVLIKPLMQEKEKHWYICVPKCIQEDRLPKVSTHFTNNSQIPQQDVLPILWQYKPCVKYFRVAAFLNIYSLPCIKNIYSLCSFYMSHCLFSKSNITIHFKKTFIVSQYKKYGLWKRYIIIYIYVIYVINIIVSQHWNYRLWKYYIIIYIVRKYYSFTIEWNRKF
jgi:hypothetical protein